MSCIYGPRQLGTEDQGWLAHFLLSAMQDRPLSLYGDGRQVRDVLEVEDAVSAYLAARTHAPRMAGEVFNLGGGSENAITLLMLIGEIERLTDAPSPAASIPGAPATSATSWRIRAAPARRSDWHRRCPGARASYA